MTQGEKFLQKSGSFTECGVKCHQRRVKSLHDKYISTLWITIILLLSTETATMSVNIHTLTAAKLVKFPTLRVEN